MFRSIFEFLKYVEAFCILFNIDESGDVFGILCRRSNENVYGLFPIESASPFSPLIESVDVVFRSS